MGENGEVITATVHKEKEAKDIFDNTVGQPKAGFHEPAERWSNRGGNTLD